MSNRVTLLNNLKADVHQSRQNYRRNSGKQDFEFNQTLPILITRAASRHTYYTIRFLVDRDRTLNAYRAYAYFRWVDDWLDEELSERCKQLAFVERQQALLNACYQGERPGDLTAEERMLVDLIRSDREQNSGLQSYLRNMMSVMAFDAGRRGRLVSQEELAAYSRHLSIAVTDALHYFIGHDDPSPRNDSRYLSVTAAHVTHMLRDTFEDIAAGYYNVPREFLESQRIAPWDVESDGYRMWVKRRVQLARAYFNAGKDYLAHVKNPRRRIAGYAYMARFQGALEVIEREDYRLRPEGPERKSLKAGTRMGWSVLSMLFNPLVREES